jgi:hypothetical protein
MAHVGTWMPFDKAVRELRFFTHVEVSEPTMRRDVEAAGAAYVALQNKAVEVIKRDLPPAPPGPDLQQLSVDGAIISLVDREWAEVRTLAVGVVEKPVLKQGEWQVHTGQVSYFSRLCDAATFGDLALVETHRRGTESAQTVCAVVDGAEWEQGFIDLHRNDAVRILDFPHAGGYVSTAGQVIYGQDTELGKQWLADELHHLKHDSPQMVLADLRHLEESVLSDDHNAHEKKMTIRDCMSYLDKRQDQMRYAEFIALGYPIGSGMVESGNKVVVEARLKGAGMHWERVHVNPMLALRNIACSDRWDEAWPQISQQMRTDACLSRKERHKQRTERKQQVVADLAPAATAPLADTHQATQPVPPNRHVPQPPERVTTHNAGHRPAADHPWRHAPIGRAHIRRSGHVTDAKL